MIASMTGYGKCSFANENIKLIVEIKSINSKQLDLTLRMPSMFKELETSIRNIISLYLERGKVEVSINYENLRGVAPARLNTVTLIEYKKQIDELVKVLDIPSPQDWLSLLFRMPDAMITELQQSDELENELLLSSIRKAVSDLTESRINEGKALYAFFFEKIERIRELLNKIEPFETERVSKIRERLMTQISKLQGVEIDEGRLEQEMIFYVEKLDVTEEKLRLRSHLTYFEETLGEPDESNITGKGKKLGFISQEIGREINTLGSKSNDADMQKLVVMMKDELEQIKEQVLNVL